jgi:dCMP deaminase
MSSRSITRQNALTAESIEKIREDIKQKIPAVSRPSWDEYFSEIAKTTAKRSPCHRLQVGCVLVKDNRIISTGYNGFLPYAEHKSIVRDDHEQATVHAEQNAIIDCAKRGVMTNEAIAYVTHHPCLNCYKILVGAGIKKINYINDYKNDPIVYEINNDLKIEIHKIE